MTTSSPVTFRTARRDDLDAIVAMLADDIARSRSGHVVHVTPGITAAFDEIESDPNNELIVGEQGGAIVASLQLTYIPGLSRGGMRRAQIESVRVRADLRGQRIGQRLIEAAIDRARHRGCGVMQLTTDLRRTAGWAAGSCQHGVTCKIKKNSPNVYRQPIGSIGFQCIELKPMPELSGIVLMLIRAGTLLVLVSVLSCG